jgi:hypothetical protein
VIRNLSTQTAQSAPQGAGAVHVTYQVNAIDAKGVAAFFKTHGPKLADTLRGQMRNFTGVAA